MTLNKNKHTLNPAVWTETLKRSMLRQMIGVVSQPGIISFAGGLPDPALFPQDALRESAAAVLQEDPLALQYRRPFDPLKGHIVDLMAKRGIDCQPEEIFITTGAQQALNILTLFLLNPGDKVLLEALVYTGMQQAVAPRQPHILTVGTDLASGIDVDEVEALLLAGERPAFIYLITESHNPLGVSISLEKRHRLLGLARQYGIPLIEDDPYGFLHYDGEMVPPMYALDPEWVFYVGSFSKILAPGFRVGWMIVPERYWDKLTVVKEAIDLETSAFNQRLISRYLDRGELPEHLANLCRAYGGRRDAMLQAMATHFPPEAHWCTPESGMFIWVELPEHVDAMALLETAVAREKVAFIPGLAFAVDGESAANCIRLNFSNSNIPLIEEGIARLGRLLHEVVQQ